LDQRVSDTRRQYNPATVRRAQRGDKISYILNVEDKACSASAQGGTRKTYIGTGGENEYFGLGCGRADGSNGVDGTAIWHEDFKQDDIRIESRAQIECLRAASGTNQRYIMRSAGEVVANLGIDIEQQNADWW